MMCGWCGVWCNGSHCSKYCRNRSQEEAEQNYYRQGPSIDDYYEAMQKDMEEQYERDMQEEYEKELPRKGQEHMCIDDEGELRYIDNDEFVNE